MTNVTYAQVKPIVAQLQNGSDGQWGPVLIEDTQQKVARAEHSNGHRKGFDTHTIRRFLIDGKPVDVIAAAKAIYSAAQ